MYSFIHFLLYLFYFIQINAKKPELKIEEKQNELTYEYSEEELKLLAMYFEYVIEPKSDEFYKELSLFSYYYNCKTFIDSFFEPLKNKKFNFVYESKENGEMVYLSTEFSNEFKKYTEKFIEVSNELSKNLNNFSLEKKFCKLYSFVYSFLTNKTLLENQLLKDRIKKEKNLPSYEDDIFDTEIKCETKIEIEETIKKCFSSPSFMEQLHHSHLYFINIMFSNNEKSFLTIQKLNALKKLIGPLLLNEFVIEKDLFHLEMEQSLDPSVRWKLYEKIFMLNIEEEKMHNLSEEYFSIEEKQLNISILFKKITVFEGIIFGYLDNSEDNKKLLDVFKLIKSKSYYFFKQNELNDSIYMLYSLFKFLNEEINNFINFAKEGKPLEIVDKINKEIENVNNYNVVDSPIDDELTYNFKIREIMAKGHLNYLDQIFKNDQNKVNIFKNKRGTTFLLMSFLDGCDERNQFIEKYNLFSDDVFLNNDQISKNYENGFISNILVVYVSNILMAHFTVWFRSVYYTIYSENKKGLWKSLEKKKLIIYVFNLKKIFLHVMYESFYLASTMDINNKFLHILGLMEAIKIWIERKMGEDDIIQNESVNHTSEVEKLCDEWNNIVNKQYSNEQVSNEFMKWIRNENYNIIMKLLTDNSNPLLIHLIRILDNEKTRLEVLRDRLKAFVEENKIEDIINAFKKYVIKKEIKVTTKQEKKKNKKEKEKEKEEMKRKELEKEREEEKKKREKERKNKEEKKTKNENDRKKKKEEKIEREKVKRENKLSEKMKEEENLTVRGYEILQKDDRNQLTSEKSTDEDKLLKIKENIKIEYFIEDKNLFDSFNQFIKGKTKIGINLLSIAIYSNEIEKRIKFFENLKEKHFLVFCIYFNTSKNGKEIFSELKNKWEKIKEKSLLEIEENKVKKIELKLFNLLILLLTKTEKNNFKEIADEEINLKITEKLNLLKISSYFLNQNLNGKLNNKQRQFVQELLNLKEKNRINEWTEKIEKRVENLKKMTEQIEIDKAENENYLNPEGFQSLSFKENIIQKLNEIEPLDISLININKIKNKNLTEILEDKSNINSLINQLFSKKEQIKNAKELFKLIFDKWINLTKNNNFGLLMASPFNNGGHIQAIIVAVGTRKEEEKIKAKQIFKGEEENNICRHPFVFNCKGNSLFCYLCKKKNLIKNVYHTSDENIHFEIEETEFDLFFVYKSETLIVPNNSNWIKLKKDENSYNLYLFKNYEYLEKLINERNENEQLIFNQTFIALKNWAKEYSVYNTQFGLLNSNIIALMLIKVFLIYPEANLNELIERFFITYLTWNWKQIPLRITNKPKNEQNNKKKSEIEIYTPTYPEQLISLKITKFTSKIIFDALLKGLNTINISTFAEDNKNKKINYFEKSIEGNEFKKNYKNYILISCITKTQKSQEYFCSWVESQLLSKIEKELIEILDEVDYCHIGLKSDKCQNNKIKERTNICTCWLIGIKLNNKLIKNNNLLLSTKLNEIFKKIKEQIINKFIIENLGKKIEANNELNILGISNNNNEINNWGFSED